MMIEVVIWHFVFTHIFPFIFSIYEFENNEELLSTFNFSESFCEIGASPRRTCWVVIVIIITGAFWCFFFLWRWCGGEYTKWLQWSEGCVALKPERKKPDFWIIELRLKIPPSKSGETYQNNWDLMWCAGRTRDAQAYGTKNLTQFD